VYARTASGNAAPLRTLQGPATGLNRPFSLAFASTPLLALSVSPTSFTPGTTLLAGVTVGNLGSAISVDAYFGALLPAAAGPAFGCPAGGAIALLADAFTRIVFTCQSD